MLSLICPSTLAFLASAAGALLFIALPASVQPRLTMSLNATFRGGAAAPAPAPLQAPLF